MQEENFQLREIEKEKLNNFDKIQNKLSEMMKTNGDLFRQCEILKEKNLDINKKNINQTAKTEELRRILNQYESNMLANHENSLKTNQVAIERYEELSKKYNELRILCEQHETEIQRLEDINIKLEYKNRDWENILKEKVNFSKLNFSLQNRTRLLRRSSYLKLRGMKKGNT